MIQRLADFSKKGESLKFLYRFMLIAGVLLAIISSSFAQTKVGLYRRSGGAVGMYEALKGEKAYRNFPAGMHARGHSSGHKVDAEVDCL